MNPDLESYLNQLKKKTKKLQYDTETESTTSSLSKFGDDVNSKIKAASRNTFVNNKTDKLSQLHQKYVSRMCKMANESKRNSDSESISSIISKSSKHSSDDNKGDSKTSSLSMQSSKDPLNNLMTVDDLLKDYTKSEISKSVIIINESLKSINDQEISDSKSYRYNDTFNSDQESCDEIEELNVKTDISNNENVASKSDNTYEENSVNTQSTTYQDHNLSGEHKTQTDGTSSAANVLVENIDTASASNKYEIYKPDKLTNDSQKSSELHENKLKFQMQSYESSWNRIKENGEIFERKINGVKIHMPTEKKFRNRIKENVEILERKTTDSNGDKLKIHKQSDESSDNRFKENFDIIENKKTDMLNVNNQYCTKCKQIESYDQLKRKHKKLKQSTPSSSISSSTKSLGKLHQLDEGLIIASLIKVLPKVLPDVLNNLASSNFQNTAYKSESILPATSIRINECLRNSVTVTKQLLDSHVKMYDTYQKTISSSHQLANLKLTEDYIHNYKKIRRHG